MMTWQQINRLRIRHIRTAELIMLRVFAQVRRELRQALQGIESTALLESTARNFRTTVDMQTAYERIYSTTGVAFAKLNHIGLKHAGRQLETKRVEVDPEQESVWLQQMLIYVRTKCTNRIAQTTRVVYDDIERATVKAIALGAQNGWGALRVADEIVKQQGEIEKWRALRIARTETIAASNAGAMAGANDVGIALNKVWLATRDDRTRQEHLDMDNVAVGYNDDFIVDGERLEYPGDPNGSPENVINCRCAVAFEPVENIIGQYQ